MTLEVSLENVPSCYLESVYAFPDRTAPFRLNPVQPDPRSDKDVRPGGFEGCGARVRGTYV